VFRRRRMIDTSRQAEYTLEQPAQTLHGYAMEPAPPIGRILGSYQILEKIGRGGMGEIYKGFHPALDRHVAIKVLGRSPGAGPSLTLRFQREAKAAAALRHPHIVRVFDFGSRTMSITW
jgi:serine/threonine protein kinase